MPSDLEKQSTEAYDEHELLVKYSERVGGILYMEVRVGKHGLDTEARLIDAVRIPSGGPRQKRFQKSEDQEEFGNLISGAEVEVVEVKRELGRGVIGQAVVAKHLLEMEYDTLMAVPVVVCGEGDALLEKVCRGMGIKVWTPTKGFIVPQRQEYEIVDQIIDGLSYKEDIRYTEPDENEFRKAQFKRGWQAAQGQSYGSEALAKLTWNNLGYRIGKLLGTASADLIDRMYDLCVEQQKSKVGR